MILLVTVWRKNQKANISRAERIALARAIRAVERTLNTLRRSARRRRRVTFRQTPASRHRTSTHVWAGAWPERSMILAPGQLVSITIRAKFNHAGPTSRTALSAVAVTLAELARTG
jgi:hypothetical protein